ncbi:MAG: ribosome silencing factor [Candidatus Brocadiaceae bacterium]
MVDDIEALACTCARLADERKAEDIVVLNVGPQAFFTDYFVIATGRNERQIQAIADEVVHRMKGLDHAILGVEGEAESGWVLIDLGEVIVHLFETATRALYDLELLWGEAPRTAWQDAEALGGPART